MTNSAEIRRIPWKPIEKLSPAEQVANGSLAALDALRDEWAKHLSSLTEEERVRVRQKTLRRLSIETGIIERLYDIEWGLTLTLIAEGFARDVIERAGGNVDDRILLTLRAQMDSLQMVLDFVGKDRRLSSSFIKELHSAITRTQHTYIATDTLGRAIETELPHGQWKTQPNHVLRSDNTLLEYAPPEQVSSEIDRIVEYYEDLEQSSTHPIIKASWLHHRFVQIHPFADGNGRVARALTLLVLERHHYPPLVVDRFHREDYIKALEAANTGNLDPLIRLFARLESAALTSELERPEEPIARGLSAEVARTLAAQLAALRRKRRTDIQEALTPRTIAIGARIEKWFLSKREEILAAFATRGLGDVEVIANLEMPPHATKTFWFRRQVITSAREAGHYADFSSLAGWCSLRIKAEGLQLRYVASLHGAGRDVGVMAVTTFGELEPLGMSDDQESESASRDYIRTTKDAFRFVHTESIEAIDKRGAELEELLDEGLTEALTQLLRRL